jgi:prepilin-type N-terminal cleavage/methylation domain-containing protein
MNIQTEKKGFTIIEVVLVLAIAALIFLMVFVALPALQRGQRDTARKQDVGKVVSAINAFKSNNRGSIEELDNTALQSYVREDLSQVLPDQVTISDSDPAEDSITVASGSKCAANGEIEGGTARQAAVRVLLESGTDEDGSGGVIYCETA